MTNYKLLTCVILCSGVRPFGVSLLVAGYDDKGPQLYQVRNLMLILCPSSSAAYLIRIN